MLRKESEFSHLSEKEWIAFQIDYITRNIGHENLRSIERSNYFKKTVQQTIGYDKIKEHFIAHGITCFDEKGKMIIFYIFTPLDGDNRIVFTLNDENGFLPITQEKIDEMLSNGLRILSKTKQEEYLEVLSGKSILGKEEINISQDIRNIAILPEVMAKFEEAASSFKDFIKYTENKGCEWIHD